MVKTFSIELPESVSFGMQREAGEYTFNLTSMDVATVVALIAAGGRETSGNAGGTPKEDETAAEAVVRCADAIQANDHSFGGGGGAKLSPVTRILREWLVDDLTSREVCGVAKMKRADRFSSPRVSARSPG